jgi:hypothetical protein
MPGNSMPASFNPKGILKRPTLRVSGNGPSPFNMEQKPNPAVHWTRLVNHRVFHVPLRLPLLDHVVGEKLGNAPERHLRLNPDSQPRIVLSSRDWPPGGAVRAA